MYCICVQGTSHFCCLRGLSLPWLTRQPCHCRQNGSGLNAMFARVAGILAPLIGLLDVYHHAIPMVIYGSLPFLAGALCFMLPETLNTELLDHTDALMDKNT